MRLTEFNPGLSPCGGRCELEDMAGRFDLPVQTPHQMIIPSDSIISKMSYAVNGEPRWKQVSMITTEDHFGVGYLVEGNVWMVRFDECLNWAEILIFPGEILSRNERDNFVYRESVSVSPTTVTVLTSPSTVVEYVTEIPRIDLPRENIPQIDLLSSIWYLLAALAVLAVTSVSRYAR